MSYKEIISLSSVNTQSKYRVCGQNLEFVVLKSALDLTHIPHKHSEIFHNPIFYPVCGIFIAFDIGNSLMLELNTSHS
jgi:hypothetical protein